MGVTFELWLRAELEEANKYTHDQEIWKRKNSGNRVDHLESALKILEEFKALQEANPLV